MILRLLIILSISAQVFSQDAFFGDSTQNGTTTPIDGTEAWALAADIVDHLYTASTGDQVTAFALYASSDGGDNDTVSLAVYVVSGGVPTTRVGSAVKIATPFAGGGARYDSTGLSIALSAGVTYCIAIGDEVGAVSVWFDDAGEDSRSNHSGGSLDASWSHQSWSSRTYSFWAVVTNTITGANVMIRQ